MNRSWIRTSLRYDNGKNIYESVLRISSGFIFSDHLDLFDVRRA